MGELSTNLEKKKKWSWKRKLLAAAAIAAVAVAVFAVWLYAWDGGFPTGKERTMLPGVQLHLQTVATPRGQVEYDLYGSEGPVVLSVHAGLGGADQGRLFASWLQDDGFRIVSPSRPGYLGTPLSGGETLEEQADLMAALLDELKIDRVGLLAASAGAPAAYTFAAKYPERVWGLVSISGTSMPKPGGKPSSGPSFRKLFMNTVGQKAVMLTARLSLRSVLESTLDETGLFTGEQKTRRADYILSTPETKAFFLAMLGTTFPYEQRTAGNDNDAAQVRAMQPLPLERIRVPSLILHGTLDGDVPFENGLYAAEHIPGAEHYWMEDEDHFGFWLSPQAEEVQAIARAFLIRHSPAR